MIEERENLKERWKQLDHRLDSMNAERLQLGEDAYRIRRGALLLEKEDIENKLLYSEEIPYWPAVLALCLIVLSQVLNWFAPDKPEGILQAMFLIIMLIIVFLLMGTVPYICIVSYHLFFMFGRWLFLKRPPL